MVSVGMVYPSRKAGPGANPDMPPEVLKCYEEAREVLPYSPRAGALLRLGIQQLMPALGLPGKNINDDIGTLVKGGLPEMVQQSLDAVRVIGNDVVHPGEIDTDDKATVLGLFGLVNLIVDHGTTRPKEARRVHDTLPASKRKAIQERDGT